MHKHKFNKENECDIVCIVYKLREHFEFNITHNGSIKMKT